jgi:hypothetical protein
VLKAFAKALKCLANLLNTSLALLISEREGLTYRTLLVRCEVMVKLLKERCAREPAELNPPAHHPTRPLKTLLAHEIARYKI